MAYSSDFGYTTGGKSGSNSGGNLAGPVYGRNDHGGQTSSGAAGRIAQMRDALRAQKKEQSGGGGEGCLHLIDVQNSCPPLWAYIATRTKRLASYQRLRIDERMLAQALAANPFPKVVQFCEENALHLDFCQPALREAKLDAVEQEEHFEYDIPFAYAFAKFLAREGSLPTEAQLWQEWRPLNNSAMERNFTPHLRFGIAKPSCFDVARAERESNGKSTKADDVCDAIENAARFRSGKAWAAFIREFHTTASLTEAYTDPHEGILIPPVRAYWHPLVDVECKADALIDSPSPAVGFCALAIYLESRDSRRYIEERKNTRFPALLTDYALEAAIPAIPLKGQADAVHLLTTAGLTLLRHALNGDPRSLQKFYTGSYQTKCLAAARGK